MLDVLETHPGADRPTSQFPNLIFSEIGHPPLCVVITESLCGITQMTPALGADHFDSWGGGYGFFVEQIMENKLFVQLLVGK